MTREARSPGWPLRIGFILLALAAPLLVGYDFYYQFRTPVIDFELDWQTGVVGQVIQDSFANYAGLMPGDVILSADGVPFSEWGTLSVHNYMIEVEREGQRITLELPVVPMVRLNFWRLVSAAIIVWVFWSFSAFLLLRRPQQQLVRLLFVQGQVLALTMVYPLAHPAPWDSPPGMLGLSLASFYFLAPLTLHLHITFPVHLGTSRQRRWGLALIYLLALASMGGWLSGSPFARRIGEINTLLIFAASIAALFYAYFRRATPDGRRRLRLIWFGTLLSMLPTILFFFMPGLYHWPYQMPVWLVGLFLVAVPLSYLYAITRHNLFGIDRFLNRAVVYATLSLGILALYLGPFLLIYRYAPGDMLAQMMAAAGLTLLVGAAFSWTRERVQRWVDRLFYGGWYDYPGVVETVSDALSRSIERRQVVEVLTHQVPVLMQMSSARLWIGSLDDTPPVVSGSPDLRFIFHLQEQRRGVWTVSQHSNGEDFTESDRRILATLAHQAEIALNNVLLVEALRRQIEEIRASRAALALTQRQLLRSREEERARLARDLHDSPIQALVGMNLQLGLLLTPTSSKGKSEGESALRQALQDMRSQVRSLLSELRQMCTDLRPPTLDTLGLGAALRILADDWSGQTGVTVHLDLPADVSLRPLPDEAAVNLYRVAQEALANVARHAAARQVTLRLAWQGDCLALSIRDDGRGFALPKALRNLVEQGHFGLVGMQERVELIGGQLSIESTPGRGATILVTWQPTR